MFINSYSSISISIYSLILLFLSILILILIFGLIWLCFNFNFDLILISLFYHILLFRIFFIYFFIYSGLSNTFSADIRHCWICLNSLIINFSGLNSSLFLFIMLVYLPSSPFLFVPFLIYSSNPCSIFHFIFFLQAPAHVFPTDPVLYLQPNFNQSINLTINQIYHLDFPSFSIFSFMWTFLLANPSTPRCCP